jgi:hypothetical protein
MYLGSWLITPFLISCFFATIDYPNAPAEAELAKFMDKKNEV